MSFIIGPMRQHLDGHKDLTAHNEILTLNPDTVYIRLALGPTALTPLVKEGDKVKIGDKVAERNDHFYVPIYSSVSGVVKGIVKLQGTDLKPTDHIAIENDHKDTKAEGKFLKAGASKQEVIDYMKEIGLCGQGGAGFPSYIKFNTDKCETLIVNAVECEPYITADARNMEENMDYLKQGIKFAMTASGAKKGVIAIKEYKKEMIGKLQDLVKDIENFSVCPVPDAYPMGWERSVLFEVTGKRYNKLPIEAGCVVSNVTSVIELAKSAATGLPIYEKYVTVSGDAVKDPHNVKARVGSSFEDLLNICGGVEDTKVVLLSGGPMMGASVMKTEVVTNTFSNAVTCLKYVEPDTVKCLRCGNCIDHCPSGLEPVNIVAAHKTNNFDALAKLKVTDCVECGMCTYICPSKIEVTENVRRAKKAMMARMKK